VIFAREKGIEIPKKTSLAPLLGQPTSREQSKAVRIQETLQKICTTDRKNPGAKGLWNPRDEVLYDAIEFMIDTIDEGECKCRHNKIASITYHKGIDRHGTPFKDLDKERYGLETKLKEAAFFIVPPERRFGFIIDNVLIYNQSKCNCSIPSHINFIDPSRKNAKIPKIK
jgi:hypothetical protein